MNNCLCALSLRFAMKGLNLFTTKEPDLQKAVKKMQVITK